MKRAAASVGVVLAGTLSACSPAPMKPGSVDALLRFAAVAQDSRCSEADCLPGAINSQNAFSGGRDLAMSVGETPVSASVACDRESAPFGGGKGTQAEPFVICSASQWGAIHQAPGAVYRIVADIDFAGQAPAQLPRFTGSLFGDSHRLHGAKWKTVSGVGLIDRNEGVIRDLDIENFRVEAAAVAQPDRVALFVVRNRGTLRNIRGGEGNRIELTPSVNVRSPAAEEAEDLRPVEAWRVGGLTAENSGTIEDCEWIIQVAVAPESEAVGGIAAWNRGTLRRTTARAWIHAPQSQAVGGVVGMNAGELRQVRLDLVPFAVKPGEFRSTPSQVVGREAVGGLAGRSSGIIQESSAWASVRGERDTGGVVGLLVQREARVADVTFNGAVTGGSPLGGIAGRSVAGALVVRARSDGMIEGTGADGIVVGGIVGLNDGSLVEHSRSQGTVSARGGRGVSGGVVGFNTHPGGAFAYVGGQVQSSTSSARVYAAGLVGGVVGENCTECRVWDSSAQSVADGAPELHCYYDRSGLPTVAGGIVGRNWGEVSGAFARLNAADVSHEAGGCKTVGRIVGDGDVSRVRALVSRAPASEG